MINVANIAKGLTEVQRNLLELAATHDYVCAYAAREIYLPPLIRCLKPIAGSDTEVSYFRIAPLGLAVFDLLKSQLPAGGSAR